MNSAGSKQTLRGPGIIAKSITDGLLARSFNKMNLPKYQIYHQNASKCFSYYRWTRSEHFDAFGGWWTLRFYYDIFWTGIFQSMLFTDNPPPPKKHHPASIFWGAKWIASETWIQGYNPTLQICINSAHTP